MYLITALHKCIININHFTALSAPLLTISSLITLQIFSVFFNCKWIFYGILMFLSYRSVLGGASLFIFCQQSSQSITPSCSPAVPHSPSSLALSVQGSAWQNGGSRCSHFWSQASTPAPEAGCTSTLQGGIWTKSGEACLVRWSGLKLERRATSDTQEWGKSVKKSNYNRWLYFL